MSHIDLSEHPAYKAMLRMDGEAAKAVAAAGLDPLLAELVKIRVSQLNGCAFCLRMHTRDALQMGETTDRLSVVAAWWESQYFSPEEQAALVIAERVTLIGDHGRLPDRGITPEDVLTEKQIAAVTWLVVVINSWNRIAITSHYPVAP